MYNHLSQRTSSLQNSFFALRHGQSLANVAGKIASHPEIAGANYALSEVGKQQVQEAAAECIAVYLKQQQKDEERPFVGMVILSSDLLRAKETASIVRDAVLATTGSRNSIPLYQNDIIIDTRFRERWFGDYDMTSDENYHKVWQDDAIDPNHKNAQVESVNCVMERVTQAVVEWDNRLHQQLQSLNSNSNYMVVCVAHGDVLQILQTAFCNMDGSKHRTLEHLETAKLRPLQWKPPSS